MLDSYLKVGDPEVCDLQVDSQPSNPSYTPQAHAQGFSDDTRIEPPSAIRFYLQVPRDRTGVESGRMVVALSMK